MKMRVDIVECRGTSYDIGVQQARALLACRRYPRRRRNWIPVGFDFEEARGALQYFAPNLWEEFRGLAHGLDQTLEETVREFGNLTLRYPPTGCSAVIAAELYGRNYDFRARDYEPRFAAVQPQGVHASLGFSHFLIGRLDGMNEHGLAVGLHAVELKRPGRGFLPILIVRMVLDQCATTTEAVALLQRLDHGFGYNYSMLDAGGDGAIVEAGARGVAVHRGARLACTNHFRSLPLLDAGRYTRSRERLPPLEAWSMERHDATALFHRLNDARSPAFHHGYAKDSGTLHTIVCEPRTRLMQVGIGGDATPASFDLACWTGGTALPVRALEGVLGGRETPFRRTRTTSRSASLTRVQG